MTPLRPRASNPFPSVARTLYDIAEGFDSPLDIESRLRRALRLLRRIVPSDRCALFEAPVAGAARLVVEPDIPEEQEALRRVLTRSLTVITGEPRRAADSLPPNIAHLMPCASHLTVPLLGLDRVLGVLFVNHHETDAYTDDHLRLMSIVASQTAAYLTACRLLLAAIQRAVVKDVEDLGEEARVRETRERIARLSPRETEVFALVVTGMLNKQIAAALGIGEKTVKVHRARVMEKMRAGSFAELVRLADRMGVIVPKS